MNALNWFEIPVSNIDRAQKFYQGLLGQDLKRESFGGTAHAIFPAKEPGVSGALVEMNGRKPATEGTLIYLNADGRLDGCLERAPKHGGAVLLPKTDIAPHGFIAHVRDTEGNVIGLHSMT